MLTYLPATRVVALRPAPALAVTVTVAEAGPVFAPLIFAHAAPDEEYQLQPLEVVTVTVFEPAPDAKLNEVGETEYVQVVAFAAWLTVTFLPATTTVALLLAPAFAVTVTVAVPEPVFAPLADAQDEPDAVHAQPLDVVTVTLFELAAEVKLSAVGDTV